MTTLITMPSQTMPLINEVMLCAWVAQAVPGDVIEYHRGFLGIDRCPHGQPMSLDARAALISTSDRALRLAEDGLVHLVQRRLGTDRFSYLAIARPRFGREPLSVRTLMLEEAA